MSGSIDLRGGCRPPSVAHIRKVSTDSGDGLVFQSVADHCRNVATLCSDSLESIGLAKTGYFIGLLHDMGKCTDKFNKYISDAAEGLPVSRGSVNHTFAAVKFLFSRYCDNSEERYVCEILGWVMGSHHGQFDCLDPYGESGFSHRINNENEIFEESRLRFLHEVANEQEIDELFGNSREEIIRCVELLKVSANSDSGDSKKKEIVFLFNLSALCRMILSALIDADREDTATFMEGPDRLGIAECKDPHWRQHAESVDARMLAFSQETQVQKARSAFSRQCAEFSYKKGSIYRLWLPTGGGKTLSSLRAALLMADQDNASRLFFVIPLLSVLEQNASVIRDYLGDDSLILEHHSNVLLEECESNELGRNETLTETWRSPVVITTLVQLLNTLFEGNGSCVRRMNALANSIIVIDEVQSVPREHLSCFNLMINYLVEFCGVSVILSSATQPCFENLDFPMKKPIDIVKYSEDLWEPFSRTKAIRIKDPFDYDELAEFVCKCQKDNGSVLLVCNTKTQAREIYQRVVSSHPEALHLSTGMCMAHRIDTVKKIEKRLEAHDPVICISTQLVEAGVDLSFCCVIRVLAGIDNIAQAAGRCNRNGERAGKSPVFIVKIKNEKLRYLNEIAQAQSAAENVFANCDDPFCSEAVSEYYSSLFSAMRKGSLDGPYRTERGTVTLLDLLSLNDQAFYDASEDIRSCQLLRQAAKTAGKLFKVFDEKSIDVIVPYEEGKNLIADFMSDRAKRDEVFRKKLAEKAKRFSVSLFAYQIRGMGGAVATLGDNDVMVLSPAFYSREFGVDEQGKQDSFLGF